MVDSINNQNINQPGLNASKKNNNIAQDKDPKIEVEKLQKELQSRIELNKTRLEGNEKNTKQLEKEIRECGVWAKVSGHKAGLEKELKTDREFRQNLLKQQAQLEKTQIEAQKLMSQGKVQEAQALLLGREVQRKQDLQNASSKYMSGLKDTNKGYKDADKFLERTETGLKIARNTAVVVGATVATGGAAGAMMAAGYGTAAVAGGAIVAGTATGTGIGALSNTAKATEEVAVYGRDAKEAFSEAGSQTLQDAKSSATASAGTALGLGAAGKVVGQAGSLGAKALSGMVAGGTNSVVSTTINVTEARIKAEQEFTSLYSEQIKNMTPDQVSGLKEQFLSQRGLTTEQIIKNAAVDVSVGLVSGSQGGASGAVKEATKSTLKKAAMTGLEASGSVAIGFTGAYAKEGELTFETVAQEISSAVVGDIVGEMASKQEVKGKNKNQKAEVNENKPPEPKPRLSLVDSDDVVLSRGETPLFDEQIIGTPREAPEIRDGLKTNNGKKWPTKIEPENLPSEIQNDNSFVAGNRGDKKTVIFEDPNLEEYIGGDAINLSRSPSENIHRVRLIEGAVKKINDPSSPEHTSSLRYLHEEIAHTHQKNFDLADPTKMSKDQFIAEQIMNELVAKNTSNIKIGRENRGQDFGKLREAIDKGDYASAREFAEAWGKKYGTDCGFYADFYYDFYGKQHDDANSSSGGRTEVRRPSLAVEDESSTAVLDRPKNKSGNGKQDREVFQAKVGSREEGAHAVKEFLAGTDRANGKSETSSGNGKVRTEGAVKSNGRVPLSEKGNIKVQAGKDGIYESSQRPATDARGNRLPLDSDRSKAARYDTGAEIEVETASGKKNLPVLVEPTVRQNGSELPHETITNREVQELLENNWRILEDGLFIEKGNRGNRQESSGLEHLIEIHTEPITAINHLIDSTTHGKPVVQRASQFPHKLNKTQMVQLIREALQNPDRVIMSSLYGKENVLNIFAKLNNNELAPGITEVRITYSPENGLLTFAPSRGYITATLAKKGTDGKPVMAEGGKKPQKVDETDLLPENREKLMVVYIDDKGRVLNPENPSQGPTPLPSELVNSN